MNRIKPEQVVEAFKATGLTAYRGGYKWYQPGGSYCACALTALVERSFPPEVSPFEVVGCDIRRRAVELTGVTDHYAMGFEAGWDDARRYPNEKDPDYKKGSDDGHAALLAMAEAGVKVWTISELSEQCKAV